MSIKQVNNFKLIDGREHESYFIIKNMQDKSEVVIAEILLLPATKSPSILTEGANLQNYVVDFEEYKSFIQLVDEAYSRLEYWIVHS